VRQQYHSIGNIDSSVAYNLKRPLATLRSGHVAYRTQVLVFGPRLVFGDGVVVKTDFTHPKDQFAGLDLNTGLVETLYESLQ
jgi:hypothetical protein